MLLLLSTWLVDRVRPRLCVFHLLTPSGRNIGPAISISTDFGFNSFILVLLSVKLHKCGRGKSNFIKKVSSIRGDTKMTFANFCDFLTPLSAFGAFAL